MASTTTLPPQRRYQGKVVLVTGGWVDRGYYNCVRCELF